MKSPIYYYCCIIGFFIFLVSVPAQYLVVVVIIVVVAVVVVCVVEQNTTFQSSVLRLNTNSSLQSKSMELFPAENSIHENLLQGDFINEKTEMGKSKARNSWAEAEKKKAVKSGVSDEVVVQLAQSNATSANSMSSSFRFRKKKSFGSQ